MTSTPTNPWTDSERIKLALFILNSSCILAPKDEQERTDAIRATTALLELPAE